ncbi:hypothetical protein [Idiomarina ramblicola]|uniref:Rad50/SbcC-type AAA domain-containing protein n=1 Tax=Idiomarina ramblicola TaxID=263724 RepID=A0A432Z0H8_9GAMM|nr:hypothetical protein [Idiomarina ramblicola]RUO69692.1 hypothetical protein CWI78_07135 [Idiomarina ramblicola]
MGGQLKSSERELISLPHLRSIGLEGFGIYQKVNGNVKLKINRNAYCLAGANGLGKSTLLSSIIFGLCGYLRRQSSASVKSENRLADAKRYTAKYFPGRLKNESSSSSSIELLFTLGGFEYRIRRLFEKPFELEELVIRDLKSNSLIYESDGKENALKTKDYENFVSKHSNLGSFERFAFAIQYISSFDENHHLLFWDSEALEDALFTCIGLDSKLSDKAKTLRHRVAQLSSQERNTQFAIKQVVDLKKKALGQINSVEGVDIESAEELFDSLEEIQSDIEVLEANVSEEKALIAQQYHKALKLENNYREKFDQLASGFTHSHISRELQKSIERGSCFNCGSDTDESLDELKKKLESKGCPVCNAELSERTSNDLGLDEELKKIDEELQKKNDNVKKSEIRLSQSEKELTELRERKKDLEGKIKSDFPNGRPNFRTEEVKENLEEYNSQIATLHENKEKLVERRKACEKEYKNCFSLLEDKYFEIESSFLPLFKELAEQFLGIPININFNKKNAPSAKKSILSISLDGVSRGQGYHFSESQRFFIDIALKMSLLKFSTKPDESVTMLLDTPEGSLDIAYEEMVGEMFYNFVSSGKSLFFTANINSSEILKELAAKCTEENMQLERMLSWSDLSSVQKKAESKFDKAYQEIEDLLTGAAEL